MRRKKMNDTSDKMTQATPDTFPGSGNDVPVMSPQKKAELYAKMALILGILAWIPYLITKKTVTGDDAFFTLEVVSLLGFAGVAFLFPLNRTLKWLEPEKRSKALVIGTIAFFANMLVLAQTMVFALILAIIIHVIRIPGHYFFLLDRKTDTVHVDAPDELTRDYLSHEKEKHPSDPMHRALRITSIFWGIALLMAVGVGINGVFSSLVFFGVSGLILYVLIEKEYQGSAIGQSLMRLAKVLMVIGIVTLIIFVIAEIVALGSASSAGAFGRHDDDDD